MSSNGQAPKTLEQIDIDVIKVILEKPYITQWLQSRPYPPQENHNTPVATDLSVFQASVQEVLNGANDVSLAAKIRHVASFFLEFYLRAIRAKVHLLHALNSLEEAFTPESEMLSRTTSLDALLAFTDRRVREMTIDYGILLSLAQRLEPESEAAWQQIIGPVKLELDFGDWSLDEEDEEARQVLYRHIAETEGSQG